jgi:hypothetical protein
MRFGFRQSLYVGGMGLIGAWMAWWARLATTFCALRPDACNLPPRPAGLYVFFIAAMVLLSGCLDALALAWAFRRPGCEAKRVEALVCLLTVAASGFVVLFYLWLLAMQS